MGRSQPEVQALLKGIAVLEVLNDRPGARVAEIAQRCRLPRTTIHRLLLTLRKCGLVTRDDATEGFFVTSGVLRLSHGFDPMARLAELSRPRLLELAREVSWPLHLTGPEELSMRVHVSTDHLSPLAVEKLLPGQCIPILQCAAGLAYLAHQPQEMRTELVDAALNVPRREAGQVAWTRPALEAALSQARECGYALFRRPQRLTEMVGLAVPIASRGEVRAALSVRFAQKAVPVQEGIKRFLPGLQKLSATLSSQWEAGQAPRSA